MLGKQALCTIGVQRISMTVYETVQTMALARPSKEHELNSNQHNQSPEFMQLKTKS